MSSPAPPVRVAGAEPTELVLALWLARSGVPVRIVDRAAGPGQASRAMVVQARTLEFYRQLGIADGVVAAGRGGGACARGPDRASGAGMTRPRAFVPRAFVLGHPVGHSRSPLLHGHWLRTLGLEGSYELADVLPQDLPAFLAGMQAQGFVGGNVTVPHKVAVMPHLARLDAAAQAIGAVNTIWIEDGALVGGNTDAAGFIANLDEGAPGWRGPAVVLGAGGAARAAVHALRERGAAVHILNRTPSHATELAARFGGGVEAHEMAALPELLRGAGLLVNTTSLGMQGKPPLEIDLGTLPREAVVYDIVYVPLETALLRQARARGHRVVDGLGMLLHQAVPGFARWFGVTPQVTTALREAIEASLRG